MLSKKMDKAPHKVPLVRIFVFILLMLLSLFLVTYMGFFNSKIVNLLERAENDHMTDQAEVILSSLNFAMMNQHDQTKAWSSWDDCYNYTEGINPQFVPVNLENGIYISYYNVDFALIQAEDGRVVYEASRCALGNETERPEYPEGLTEVLTPITKKVVESNKNGLSAANIDHPYCDVGFIVLDGVSYLITSLPVLYNGDLGEPKYAFTFVKKYDDAQLKKLTGLKDSDFVIYEGTDMFNSSSQEIKIIDKNKIAVYARILNLGNNRNATLEINQPRELYNNGISALKVSLVIIMFITVFLLIVFFIIFFRNLIMPLRRLSGDLAGMGQTERLNIMRYGIGMEFYILSTGINDMLERLEVSYRDKILAEQGSQAKSTFLSRMSHEIRTPMNAIIGMTNIAKMSDDSAKKEYCLDQIHNASNHLLGVINDILDMSKIEANKFELSETKFNFYHTLMNIISLINFRMEENQILNVNVATDVPVFIISDELRLSQVITNLLSNACKFTPNGGKVALDIRSAESAGNSIKLQVAVSDTGIGISKDQQKKLFKSFEQADGSVVRRFGGTGLGLSISKHIVELLSGEIWIESELGRGTTVTFNFMAEKADDEDEINIDSGFSNIAVMVIDDSPEACKHLEKIEKKLGAKFAFANSCTEALQIVAESQTPFDIAFISWKSVKNDVNLSRHLKIKQDIGAIIAMLSITEWCSTEKEALDAGVDGFVIKPFTSSVVMDTIKTYCRKKTQNDLDEGNDIYFNKTILLAEDVYINREIVITLLEDTGLQIDIAENGQEAVDIFKTNPEKYSLIFMDINMPEMSGIEATKRIRSLEIEWAKKVPILAMTADVFSEEILQCLDAGMNDHIGKPIDVEDLLMKLKKYIVI